MQGFSRSLVLKLGSEFIWQGRRASNDTLPLPHHITWITPGNLGAKICLHASPQLLLFPQFKQNSDLHIVPMSTGQAAFALLQNLANARNLPDRGFRLTVELARNVPAYRVTYSDETAVSRWIHTQLPER